MDSKHFGQKMSCGSSSPAPSSRRSGRKRSTSCRTNNSQDQPKAPQRGLGVAQLERLRLQDQLIRSHLNHIGSFGSRNSSNQLLQNPNQVNQWSYPSSYSSPSFPYSLPSTSPPPEYRPHKMMKFGEQERANNNPYPGATSRPNPREETRPLQNQQGEKDCVQEKRNADWLTLSLGSNSWTEFEAEADEEVDLELKL